MVSTKSTKKLETAKKRGATKRKVANVAKEEPPTKKRLKVDGKETHELEARIRQPTITSQNEASKPAVSSATSKSKILEMAQKRSQKSPKQSKTQSPSRSKHPLSHDDNEDDEQNASSSDDKSIDENVHLHGFSSDEDNSSDEDIDVDAPPIDVSRLPTIAKDDATVRQRLEKAKRRSTDQRGVLYISRIPHGFYEDQLRSYFSQFGEVTRLRLSRNKKTGKSKHYAFIEFESLSVAEIVAETMNNYLLMGHILSCNVVPKDKVHPNLWIGANRKWRVVPHDRIVRLKHNKLRTETERRKSEARLLKRQRDRKRRLLEAGIKYDFKSVEYKRQRG